MQFLGIDVSTQSISAIIIDFPRKKIVQYMSLPFDESLPRYKTQNGVIRARDPSLVHSSPMMWAEALELMLARLKKENIDLHQIKAISGSGQQHGSVYLNRRAFSVLPHLNPDKELRLQLENIFSRETAPIWMDSSTHPECVEITEAMGGRERLARLTGSMAFERFTGPQIRRFYKKEEKKYKETASIGLVSSFMASLLLGDIAPIDYGDGSGMNLMDIVKKRWHRDILKVTAPDLASKLPPLVHPITAIGRIHEYYVKRYGFKADTILNAWSGDNPNSLIGLGAVESGQAVISLGTSDTFFAVTKKMNADPNGEGHVFVAPTGNYMNLICFKNGSLARERIKKMFNLSWHDFSAHLRRTKPGNRGRILLPWFEPEIVPRVFEPGLRRFLLERDDISGHVRGVVEAQAMSMKIHSAWTKVRPSRIFVTGGASENREILEIIADVFEAPVYFLKVSKSAALGAALRAAYCYFRKMGRKISWPDVIRGFISYDRSKCLKPDRENSRIYQGLIEFYRSCEEHAVSVEEH